MKKTILIVCSVILAAFLLLLLFGKAKLEIASAKNGERVWQHSTSSDESSSGMTAIPSDGMVDASFESHLPIIVIDTEGSTIADIRSTSDKSESSHYGENVNPYTGMTMSVYDGGTVNCVSDDPSSILEGKIKIRGGSADSKPQYRIKLLDQYGDGVKVPLLGMHKDDTWILNGMDQDETDLRSYISYNLAGELNLTSPDVRYCELLQKDGDVYRYLGLYLLTEPVERGEGRVVLKGKRSLIGAYSYIVKRGKADSDSVILSTWASENAGISAFMGDSSSGKDVITLIYPKNEKVTTDAINYITSDLNKVEQLLASDRIGIYASFSDVIDTESFIDYYILNEYLMNRGAGTSSTYMYRDIGSKLTIGPVWGFNSTASHSPDIETFLMEDAPLYSDLFKNGTFDRKLLKRYAALRTDLLSDRNISRLIKETRDYLGNALLRDMSLRGISSEELDSGTTILFDNISKRGLWLDKNIGSLAGHAVVTYKYAAISLLSISLTACIIAAATVLYKRIKKGAVHSAGSGKAEI